MFCSWKTSSKENDEQFKSNLKNFYLLKIRQVVHMAHDELRDKIQEIIHNNLIMRQEDYWWLASIVLGTSLNLFVQEVNNTQLITLLCNGYDIISSLVENNYAQVWMS